MEETRLDLSKYRLEKAKDDLGVSKLNLENKKFSQSINRSYYSIMMISTLRVMMMLRSNLKMQKNS